MEERKQSERIQKSILNAVEKKVLVWMAKRMPSWVTSDMLTFVGTVGSIIICIGYIFSNQNINWLWFASFGLVVNWFGDSLDGSLARVRNQQRPVYGFYLDHNVDVINETFMFVGAGLSCFAHLKYLLMVLVAYLLLSVYVYITAHVKNEFKLTYAGMGPTELRIIAILVNTIIIYVPAFREFTLTFEYFGAPEKMFILDVVAVVLTVIILLMFLISFIKDARILAKQDPLPKKK